MKSSLLKLFR